MSSLGKFHCLLFLSGSKQDWEKKGNKDNLPTFFFFLWVLEVEVTQEN
jgi:hypothetical protein